MILIAKMYDQIQSKKTQMIFGNTEETCAF